MKKNTAIAALSGLLSLSATAQSPSGTTPAGHSLEGHRPVVRLSNITVDPTRIAEYNAALREEIEASMRLEPSVLTLYAVSDRERPCEVTILEIYADTAAYRSHIATPHFLKYKRETIDMVESLRLTDVDPLIPELKIK